MKAQTVFLYLLATLTAMFFSVAWIGFYNPLSEENVVDVINSTQVRPYVMRVLMPFLARTLTRVLPLQPDIAIFIVVSISIIMMYISLIYFFSAFIGDNPRTEVTAFICFILVIAMIGVHRKIYDPATVMLFSFSLGLLARRKFTAFYLLFPIVTLNRETSFLLTLFFIAYFYKRISMPKYLFGIYWQGLIFLGIKFSLEYIFASQAGDSFLIRPALLFQTYFSNWQPALFLLILLLASIFTVFKRWNRKPAFLRTAYLSMFPLQLLLYVIFGYAFEIRVMIESFPTLFLLSYLAWNKHPAE